MSNQEQKPSFSLGNAGVKAATAVKIKGGTINLMSSKINNFTGCYDVLPPYLGKKRTNASQYLKNNPLNVTLSEGDTIDKLVKNSTINRLMGIYNKKSDIKFNCLTKAQQTVVASVFFQYGAKTPNFSKYTTSQQWDKVSNELRNFGDKYPTRRNKEADYLEGKK